MAVLVSGMAGCVYRRRLKIIPMNFVRSRLNNYSRERPQGFRLVEVWERNLTDWNWVHNEDEQFLSFKNLCEFFKISCKELRKKTEELPEGYHEGEKIIAYSVSRDELVQQRSRLFQQKSVFEMAEDAVL